MTIPSNDDMKEYLNKPLTDKEYNYDLKTIIGYMIAGNYDFYLKTLKMNGLIDLNQNFISNMKDPVLDQDGVNLRTLKASLTASAPNSISGYRIDNDGTSPNTVIVINPGSMADSTGLKTIKLTNILKKTTGAYSVGSGSGGLPSPLTLAASTMYHLFVTMDDSGNIDAGFDTSATAANLLTANGHTAYGRVSFEFTDGSKNLRQRKHDLNSDIFIWAIDQNIFAADTISSSCTVLAPPNTLCYISYLVLSGLGTVAYLTDLNNSITYLMAADGTGNDTSVGHVLMRVNGSSQIGAFIDTTWSTGNNNIARVRWYQDTRRT